MKLNQIIFILGMLIISLSSYASQLFVENAKNMLSGNWKPIDGSSSKCPSFIHINFYENSGIVESNKSIQPISDINSGDQLRPFIFLNSDPISDTISHSTSLYSSSEAILKFIDKSVMINTKTMQIILTKSNSTSTYMTQKNGQELIFEQFQDFEYSSEESSNFINCKYRKN